MFDSQAFSQIDDLEPLPGRKSDKCPQEAKAFDCLIRWSAELPAHFHNRCGSPHLAPLTGNVTLLTRQTRVRGADRPWVGPMRL